MSKFNEKIIKLTDDVLSVIGFIPVVRELFCAVAGLAVGIIKAVKNPTSIDTSDFILDNKNVKQISKEEIDNKINDIRS